MTFGELRKRAMAKNGVNDFFAFREISPAHDAFWDEMNAVEYERGYTPDYAKPGTPALCDMDLLDPEEFQAWLARCPTR